MTYLEITLSVAEVSTLWVLVRNYQKRLIIRHLFIYFSDWCAQSIDEMIHDVQEFVPYPVEGWKTDWGRQVDHFQAQLKHNKIAPLGKSDHELMFYPERARLKFLPLKKRKL